MTRQFSEVIGEMVAGIDDVFEYDRGNFLRFLDFVADVLTAHALDREDVVHYLGLGLEEV